MLGMIVWVSACIAAAVRYRHFRWYGFVLASYTAAPIGIPNVAAPHDLFVAALTRAAEVTVGIVCSSAVSALIVPQHSSLVLLRALQVRATEILLRSLPTCFLTKSVGERSSRVSRLSSMRSWLQKRRAFSPPSTIQ